MTLPPDNIKSLGYPDDGSTPSIFANGSQPDLTSDPAVASSPFDPQGSPLWSRARDQNQIAYPADNLKQWTGMGPERRRRLYLRERISPVLDAPILNPTIPSTGSIGGSLLSGNTGKDQIAADPVVKPAMSSCTP
jgi:hypothetical protein